MCQVLQGQFAMRAPPAVCHATRLSGDAPPGRRCHNRLALRRRFRRGRRVHKQTPGRCYAAAVSGAGGVATALCPRRHARGGDGHSQRGQRRGGPAVRPGDSQHGTPRRRRHPGPGVHGATPAACGIKGSSAAHAGRQNSSRDGVTRPQSLWAHPGGALHSPSTPQPRRRVSTRLGVQRRVKAAKQVGDGTLVAGSTSWLVTAPQALPCCALCPPAP